MTERLQENAQFADWTPSPINHTGLPYSSVEASTHLPWEQPLHMQPKGRLHKSKRHMDTVWRNVSENGENTVTTRRVVKEPFDGGRQAEAITIVRFMK